jgi:hypothetical protein
VLRVHRLPEPLSRFLAGDGNATMHVGGFEIVGLQEWWTSRRRDYLDETIGSASGAASTMIGKRPIHTVPGKK